MNFDDVMSTGSSTSTDSSRSSDMHRSRDVSEVSLSPRSPSFNLSMSDISNSSTNSLDHNFSKLRVNNNLSKLTASRSTPSLLDNFKKEEKTLLKFAHMSNEYERLSEHLEHMHPQELMDILRARLGKRDSKAIVALGVLLPRNLYPAIQQAHCSRCHKTFDPYQNTNCVQRHPTAAVLKISQDKDGADFHCRACTKDFRLNHMFFYNEAINSYLTGFCYSGKHTTNPKEVMYGGAVKTCEETGCVEFYV